MKKDDAMEAVRDAVQACRDCAEIAAAREAASPDALASPSAWHALEEYAKAVKGGPAYKLANGGGTSGTVWRIMHAPTPPGAGAARLEQALWLERLWHSLHPGAKPRVWTHPDAPGVKREIWDYGISNVTGERRLYFASVDYFFGPALPRAVGTEAAHLGESFLFMGRALAAQAGVEWPDKASPLAARVAGAFRRDRGAAGGGKPKGGEGSGKYEVTQKEAARELGVSLRTVKNWDAGAPNAWGYSRDKRRNKAAFAAFVAGLRRDLSTGENMMDGAGTVHLGNRRGMGVKKGPK